MQYYPTLSQNTATFMLMVMLVDPILQNAMIVFLIGYLNESFEEGGCCVSKSIYRAYITFVCAYLLAWLVSTAFTTASIFKCLTRYEEIEGEGNRNRKAHFAFILVSVFFNVHLFLFGFAPSLHRFFDIQEAY